MGSYINFFLFILGLIIFFYKPKYVPLYSLVWPTLIIFFISLYSPISYEIYESAYGGFDYYVWVCFAISLPYSFSAMNKNDKILVLIAGLFFLYLLLIGSYRGGLRSLLMWVKGYTCFVPLWILMKCNNVSFSIFQKFVIVLFSFELLLGLVQYVSGNLYPSFSNGRFAENGAINITGSFNRYNAYADCLSLLLLSSVYVINRVKIKEAIKIYLISACIIGTILVALSGARTELIALISAMAVLYFYKFGKSTEGVIRGVVILSLVILLMNPVQSIIKKGASSGKANYGRLDDLRNFYSGESDISEQSTFVLTAYLMRDFLSDPSKMIIGKGKLFSSSRGYDGIVTSNYHMWDCFLALYICETGIIGIIFLVLFLLYILKSSHYNIYAILVLVYLLINSVTEYGLFRGTSAIYFLFIVYYEQRLARKNKLQGLLVDTN